MQHFRQSYCLLLINVKHEKMYKIYFLINMNYLYPSREYRHQ